MDPLCTNKLTQEKCQWPITLCWNVFSFFHQVQRRVGSWTRGGFHSEGERWSWPFPSTNERLVVLQPPDMSLSWALDLVRSQPSLILYGSQLLLHTRHWTNQDQPQENPPLHKVNSPHQLCPQHISSILFKRKRGKVSLWKVGKDIWKSLHFASGHFIFHFKGWVGFFFLHCFHQVWVCFTLMSSLCARSYTSPLFFQGDCGSRGQSGLIQLPGETVLGIVQIHQIGRRFLTQSEKWFTVTCKEEWMGGKLTFIHDILDVPENGVSFFHHYWIDKVLS